MVYIIIYKVSNNCNNAAGLISINTPPIPTEVYTIGLVICTVYVKVLCN